MSSLKKLKENFDRVLIKYTENSCEVLLVKGLNVFSGLSKCHGNDNFDRKLGRTIALGRAEFASKVHAGIKESRDNLCFKEGGCRHTTTVNGDVNKLDECIINFLPKNPKQKTV